MVCKWLLKRALYLPSRLKPPLELEGSYFCTIFVQILSIIIHLLSFDACLFYADPQFFTHTEGPQQ
jgi:hypothetical protein